MIRVRNSHIAFPSPPAAFAICANVFSRRIGGGITSNLQRFVVRSSASFCRNSTQYNLYIDNATDNMSHSLFSHATSSHSSVLFGADGQQSRDCESWGKDKESVAVGAETKDIKTPIRNANIPIHVIVREVIVHHAIVHRVAIQTITTQTVSVLCGQSRNLFMAPANTQHLVSHALPRIRVRFRQFYLCARGCGQRTRDFLHPHLVCVSLRRPHERMLKKPLIHGVPPSS